MKFTKKQKYEIYKKAYRYWKGSNKQNGMCHALYTAIYEIHGIHLVFGTIRRKLPEFNKLRPKYCFAAGSWFTDAQRETHFKNLIKMFEPKGKK